MMLQLIWVESVLFLSFGGPRVDPFDPPPHESVTWDSKRYAIAVSDVVLWHTPKFMVEREHEYRDRPKGFTSAVDTRFHYPFDCTDPPKEVWYPNVRYVEMKSRVL